LHRATKPSAKHSRTHAHVTMQVHGHALSKFTFPYPCQALWQGLKISATLAVIGAIVAEFNGAEMGLGKNLFLAAKRLEPDLMMTSLILSTLMGVLFFGTIYLIEKKLIKWQ
jgi:NitT/TauT family transport system permease protein